MAFRTALTFSSRFLLLPTATASLVMFGLHSQQAQLINGSGVSGSMRVLRCDSPAGKSWGSSSGGSGTTGSGSFQLNARVARQVSGGSIMGLVCGAVVAYLSKPIAILMGLFVVGVQYLEYKGVQIVPYNSLQRYFGSINLRSVVQEDPAFKFAFGIMFALAGFGQL